VLLLAAILGAVGINGWMILSTRDKILSSDLSAAQGADCVLVLGAGVRPDGSPSDMLADRVSVGIEIYNQIGGRLLMSGDHGRKNYDEVGCMLSLALAEGVEADHIFLDHAGFSTYESLYRAKEIFGAQKIVIVTQQYHLYRALYIAEALGIDAVGVAANPRTYAGQSMRDLREMVARVKDFAMVWVRPEPTYLGEKIPLSGSGTVTQEV